MKPSNIARVRLENGLVHFYNFYDRLPDANLLRQKKYRFRQNVKSEWLESIPAADHEKIAKFIEFLALSSYGREFSDTVAPRGVYRIWAGCVKNATGIILRKPRLSAIYGLGVPLNITGNKCDNPPEDNYGEVIEIIEVRYSLSHEDVVNLPDNAFAIRSSSLYPYDNRVKEHFLFGEHHSHSLSTLAEDARLVPRIPTLFTLVNATHILERLRNFLPENEWSLVPVSEIKGHYLGLVLAA